MRPANLKPTRREAILACAAWALPSVLPRSAHARREAPASPYSLEFRFKDDELIRDLLRTERGDPRLQSETPHRDWYTSHTERNLGSWGPRPRTYPALPGLEQRPVEWRQQRVIATAARFLGYGYQHHHIPDWDPPAHWSWKQTCVGHNGKGVDCSNFTSFVYNQGFGIKMTSEVTHQSEIARAVEGRVWSIPVRRVELPTDYNARLETLQTGDLVYIRGRVGGPITHVVIWVGSVGRAPSGAPLVMDSHGGGVDDDNGQPIPCGIQLRPFRDRSWYNRCASHAHRII